MPFFVDGWTVGDPTQGFNAISGTTESTYADISINTSIHSLSAFNDAQGHYDAYTNDSDAYPTVKTYSDASPEARSSAATTRVAPGELRGAQ